VCLSCAATPVFVLSELHFPHEADQRSRLVSRFEIEPINKPRSAVSTARPKNPENADGVEETVRSVTSAGTTAQCFQHFRLIDAD
jgi:hypothetical protein